MTGFKAHAIIPISNSGSSLRNMMIGTGYAHGRGAEVEEYIFRWPKAS